MDIGFLHPSHPGYDGTGSTFSANRLIDALLNSGHNVTVFCTYTPYGVNDRYNCVDLDVSWNIWNRSFKEKALLKSVENKKNLFDELDVVHAYMSDCVPALSHISNNTNAKTVLTINSYLAICPKEDMIFMGSDNCNGRSTKKCLNCIMHTQDCNSHLKQYEGLQKYPAFGYLISKRLKRIYTTKKNINLSNNIDHVCVISPHLKDKYVNSGFNRRQISVVPNIIDENFVYDSRDDFSEPFEILYVGSLVDWKGASKLIDILDYLLHISDSSFKLKVVGDGPLENVMIQQANNLGISDQIKFLGYIQNEDLPQLYRESDIFLYPGKWDEPFARAFLEVIGTTLPFVGSDVGDLDEIMGEGGMIVENTTKDLAEAINKVACPEKLKSMSMQLEEIQDDYTEDVVISVYNQIYNNKT